MILMMQQFCRLFDHFFQLDARLGAISPSPGEADLELAFADTED